MTQEQEKLQMGEKQLLPSFEGGMLQPDFYYEGSTGFSIYFFRSYISQELKGG